MKEFLRPTNGKIIAIVLLFFMIIMGSFLGSIDGPGGDNTFPLHLFNDDYSFSILNLIIDILFWYLIFCVIFYIGNKIAVYFSGNKLENKGKIKKKRGKESSKTIRDFFS